MAQLRHWGTVQRNLPASHLVEFNHAPSRQLQRFVMNAEPVDFLTVIVFVPPWSFQMAAISDSPSPSKSPDTHLTESSHPPSRSAHRSCGANCRPMERYTANVAFPVSFQTAAMSERPSPSKSPASHLTESSHPPSRSAHWTGFSKCVPSERYTPMEVLSSLFQATATSESPSPLKSPTSH